MGTAFPQGPPVPPADFQLCATADPIHQSAHSFSHLPIRSTQLIAFGVALPLTIGLLLLFVWHLQLVAVNKTTIEYQEVR